MGKQALLFPGQGAQFVGMGQEFYESYPLAREVFEEADEHLKFSLSRLILKGPEEKLQEARYCQPALFVVSMAILRVIEKQFPEFAIHFCGGLSLGEYSALVASKKASFSDTLRVVAKRGELMHKATLKENTAMVAVLGLSESTVAGAGYYIANVNSPGQVVVAGSISEMERAKTELKELGAKRVISLKVAGAYHTPYMDEARDCLKPFIEELAIMSSGISLVMNVVGEFVSDPVKIKENLIAQVSAPTRWLNCMQTLMHEKPDRYIEIGPSLLTGMCRKFGVGDIAVNIEKLRDLEKL